MDGNFSGTFMGYFTNIKMNIGSTTIDEMNTLKQLLEKPTVSITYPVERKIGNTLAGNSYTESFYGTAINAEFDNYKAKYKPFSIQFVAIGGRPLN